MKKVKHSIVLTLLIFIFSFFFCLSCDNIADSPEIHPPMSGYGRISVDLAGWEAAPYMAAPQTARTVFPTTVFDRYVYTFTRAGETAGTELNPDNNGYFTLQVGSYTVEVRAYTGDAAPYNTLAASGVSSAFSVGPGANDPVEVRLTGVAAEGEGEFSYTITYPAGAAAEITLHQWPDLDEIALTPTDLTAGNGMTETLELEAGFYLLTVLVDKDELYTGISETIHIYPALSTVYVKNFSDNDLLLAQYTVTFNANGATSGTAPNAQTVSVGSRITLPSGSGLTRTGYTFDGWNTDADGTATNYNAGSSYTVTGNITLYARWAYTVTFNANEGSGTAPNAQTVAAGSSITLPAGSGLTKTGYVFGGWNTTQDGTETTYQSGASYTPTGSITLYAKWDDTYTVTFDANGATSGTAPNAQTANAGSGITLPVVGDLLRTGYTFGGWNTTQDGTATTYQSGASYTPTGSSITLYARWYSTVTFNANSATSGTAPASQTANAGSSITLPAGSGLTKTGYAFGGWNTSQDGTGTTYQSGASYTPTGSITLYAKWDSTYTVTFNANGGSGAAPSSITGSNITLPDRNTLTRTGYVFGGWNTNQTGTGTTYQSGASYTPTGIVTLYAKWDSTYIVTFDANGGSGTVANPVPVNVGSSITLPGGSGLTRTGYAFGGWNTNQTGTGTTYQSGASFTPTGSSSITLYARWYSTVTFNANGATGTVPVSQTANAGSSITLPGAGNFTRTGFTFGGWNTNASGTGTTYQSGASYTPSGNITLYARWTSTVTFNTNGATGTAPASETVNAGASIPLPIGSGLTKDFSTFGGWNTNQTGTGTTYQSGASYTPVGNITLYAKWDPVTLDSVTGLANKLAWLQINAQSDGSYTLEANADESISPQTLSYSGKSGITITLRGTGTNRIISLSSNGAMFTVDSGVTLVLDSNITLRGNSSNTNSLVRVNSGGTLRMNTGSAIIGNTTSTNGGGVYMNGGTFTMSGGTISGNTSSSSSAYGGGVYVESGATFTMSDGTISGNTTSTSGGGVYVRGTFTKNGGIITGYASDTVNGNVVKNSSGTVINNSGHAVFAAYSSSSSDKRKETTAGPGDALSRNGTTGVISGAWDY